MKFLLTIFLLTFLSCTTANQKYTEGITNNVLTFYTSIESFEIKYGATDNEFNEFVESRVRQRAVFILAALGDKMVFDNKKKLEFGRRLLKNNFEIQTLSFYEDINKVKVWASIDILFLRDLIEAK